MVGLQEVNNMFNDVGDTYVHKAGVFLCLTEGGTLDLAYLTVWKDELKENGRARTWWDAYDNSNELQEAVIKSWPLLEVLPDADTSKAFMDDVVDHPLERILGLTLAQFNKDYSTNLEA